MFNDALVMSCSDVLTIRLFRFLELL